ncbi:MAG: hypothetical protein JWM80_2592, partial [Cyanobacteria bacterium RYN_339]|nr:hypothetical protein [Cyanobacteria bacterium RYN_339]
MAGPAIPTADVAALEARQAAQRLVRVATFAAELAQALRKEFRMLWQLGGGRARDPVTARFLARVDQLAEQAAALQAFLAEAPAPGALAAYDVEAITANARGLEGQARVFRADPRIKLPSPRPGTGPQPAAGPGRPAAGPPR